MDTPTRLRTFMGDLNDYVDAVLFPTKLDMEDILHDWSEPTFWLTNKPEEQQASPAPIALTRVRIKRHESIVDKIMDHPEWFKRGLSIRSVVEMRDAVAARIVVHFLSDIPLVDNLLRTTDRLELSEEMPVAYLPQQLFRRLGIKCQRREKESGYASIHYKVRLRNTNVPARKRPWFELQLRTLAEHCWGEIEHLLGYKPTRGGIPPATRRHFQIISAQLHAIDEHFSIVIDELAHRQAARAENLKNNDRLNADSLPAALGELDIVCSQAHVDGLLRLLHSRGIPTVGALRAVATPANLDVIKHVFLNHAKRTPNHFEMVASLAALQGVTEDAADEAVRTQLEFMFAWQVALKNIKRAKRARRQRRSPNRP